MRDTTDIVVGAILAGCLLQLAGCIAAWGVVAGTLFGLSYACFIVLASHWLARVLEAVERSRD